MFKKLEEERKSCVWLDLDDYSSVRNLQFQILSVMSLRQGRFQAEHINLVPSEGEPTDRDSYLKYLRNVFGILLIDPAESWVFLYGRNAHRSLRGLDGAILGEEGIRRAR